MKCVKQVLLTLALSGAVLTARAIPVHLNFSQGGWPSGGEITGSCIIDTDYSTVNPGTVYAEALTSFSAHWTGNAYTQPYDWVLSDVNAAYFQYSIDNHQIVDLVLGIGPTLTSVYYDSSIGFLWDDRASHIDYLETFGRYRTTDPFVSAVPDRSNTLPLLAFSLTGLTALHLTTRRRPKSN